MTKEQAARCLLELTAAFPSTNLPRETIAVWRQWLEALPYAEAKRAVAMVCAQQDFPTVHQMVAACGITAEPVLALLVAAKDGGFEVVRDDTAKHGWRSSREALPEPPPVGVPCPPDVKQAMREALARMEAKRVKPLDVAGDAGDRAFVESTLAAADATFRAELERAQRAEAGEITEEEAIPW